MPHARSQRRVCTACSAVLGGLLLAAVAPARQTLPTTVVFAPVVSAHIEHYGREQGAVVQSAIVEAVSRAMADVPLPAGATLTVTVEELAPTRATRKQQADDPGLDIVRTKYLGGASLAGEVLDAKGQVLTTVRYRYFPPTLRLGSLSRDPWADARLAIEQFAFNLAVACRKLPAS
jgi:hypothetical protein